MPLTQNVALLSALVKLRLADKPLRGGGSRGATALSPVEAAAVLDALHLITRVAEADVNMSGTAIDSELAALIREAADIIAGTR